MIHFLYIYGRWSIFADLNSVTVHRNRIYLGGPICNGPRMSENTLSAIIENCFSFLLQPGS